MSDLPDGWVWTLLPDVCKIQTGKKDVDEGNPKGSYPFFTCAAIPTKSDFYSFDGESILLPGNGANVGMVTYFQGKFEAYQRTYVLNQFSQYGKYVYYYFKNSWVKHLSGKQYGSAVNYVRMGNFTSFEIPLAPLPEQKRIADKLDALLARVEQCQTHLERVPALLKAFRQSVLAAATSGRLTEEWRNGNETNWETHPLGDLCSRVSVGHVGITSKYYTTAEEGIPFLRSQNVRPGRVDLSGLVYITREFHEHLKKSQLQAGDLLIVRVGANRGDTCVLPSGFTEINCANIVFARPTKILPAYLGIYFQSPLVQEEMLGKAVGGAQEVVNTKMIEQINVLVPPSEEQHEIVRRVERLFAFGERLEARWRAAQGQVSALTPSLLAKAFRGELV